MRYETSPLIDPYITARIRAEPVGLELSGRVRRVAQEIGHLGEALAQERAHLGGRLALKTIRPEIAADQYLPMELFRSCARDAPSRHA